MELTVEDLKDVRNSLREATTMRQDDQRYVRVILANRFPMTRLMPVGAEIAYEDSIPFLTCRKRVTVNHVHFFQEKEVWEIKDVTLAYKQGEMLGVEHVIVQNGSNSFWNTYPKKTIRLVRGTVMNPDRVFIEIAADCLISTQ